MIHISGRLYRRNPWVDTAKGKSPNFEAYLSEPIAFFMREFTGMTLPVANFLVKNVFCILDRPTDDTQRISAREFGVWVRDLPDHMTASPQVALARRQVLPSEVQDCQVPLAQHRQHGKLSNCLRTNQDKFRKPRSGRSLPSPGYRPENDREHVNSEEFFDAGSGSYFGEISLEMSGHTWFTVGRSPRESSWL